MRKLILLMAVALLLGGCRSARQITTEQTRTTDSAAVEQLTEASAAAATDSAATESTNTAVLEIEFLPPTASPDTAPPNVVDLPDGTHISGNIASVRIGTSQTDRATATAMRAEATATDNYSNTATATQDTDREEEKRTPTATKKVILWPAFVIAGTIVGAACYWYLRYRRKRHL